MDEQTANQLISVVSMIGLVVSFCLGFIAGLLR